MEDRERDHRMSEDLIRRSDAIEALRKLGHEVVVIDKVCSLGVAQEFIDVIRAIPSAPPKVVAQITFDEEKLREIVKEAVERFKEEYEITDRPQGEWIEKNVDDVKITVCSNCDKEPTFTHYYGSCGNYSLSDFCPNCGADMRGKDDE